MELGRKCLADFNARKNELFLFDQTNNTGAIVVKMDGSFLEEILIFSGVSRYCTWFSYFKDYNTTIQISCKKGN